MDREHRSYPRARSEFKVIYSLTRSGPYHTSITHDISATGMSFQCGDDIPSDKPGTILFLQIFIPNVEQHIAATATAIRFWTEDGKKFISVQFSEIDYSNFILLLDFSLAMQVE